MRKQTDLYISLINTERAYGSFMLRGFMGSAFHGVEQYRHLSNGLEGKKQWGRLSVGCALHFFYHLKDTQKPLKFF